MVWVAFLLDCVKNAGGNRTQLCANSQISRMPDIFPYEKDVGCVFFGDRIELREDGY
jgi:hypothetical protein